MRTTLLRGAALALLALAASGTAEAQTRPGGRGLGDLGSRKEPIKIDADKLEVFDREGRAVFSGNVVAVQGDSTMKCTAMNVFYEGGRAASMAGGVTGSTAAPAAPGAMPGNDSIKRIECRGPVTITSKTQVATGDRAEFDRTRNRVLLSGNAVLSDGPNVTRGERVAYDLNTGIASVEGGRVRASITPGRKDGAAQPRPR